MTVLNWWPLLPANRAGFLVVAVAALVVSAPAPASAQERVRVHEFSGRLGSLGFSATGGGYAASGSIKDDITLYDTKTGRVVRRFDSALGHAYAVAYGPADRLFASAVADRDRDGAAFIAVRVWDISTGKKQFDLRGHNADIVSVAFSPDGKTLASVQQDGKVRLWRLDGKDGKRLLATLEEHTGQVAIAFTPNGREFVTAGDDGQLIVWDAASFKLSARLEKRGGAFKALSLSAKGDELFVVDGAGKVQVWNLPKRKRTATVVLAGSDRPGTPAPDVMAVAAGPRLAAAAVGRSVVVWDLATGKAIGRCEHPRLYDVRGLSISPDGKKLLTGATDLLGKTEVVLWNLPSRR